MSKPLAEGTGLAHLIGGKIHRLLFASWAYESGFGAACMMRLWTAAGVVEIITNDGRVIKVLATHWHEAHLQQLVCTTGSSAASLMAADNAASLANVTALLWVMFCCSLLPCPVQKQLERKKQKQQRRRQQQQ